MRRPGEFDNCRCDRGKQDKRSPTFPSGNSRDQTTQHAKATERQKRIVTCHLYLGLRDLSITRIGESTNSNGSPNFSIDIAGGEHAPPWPAVASAKAARAFASPVEDSPWRARINSQPSTLLAQSPCCRVVMLRLGPRSVVT